MLLYITFPSGDQNAFQKELFHWERKLGVGGILISQMRKQEARKVVIFSRLFNECGSELRKPREAGHWREEF